MAVVKVSIHAVKCERCGKVIITRDNIDDLISGNIHPSEQCPKCHNSYWLRPRKNIYKKKNSLNSSHARK